MQILSDFQFYNAYNYYVDFNLTYAGNTFLWCICIADCIFGHLTIYGKFTTKNLANNIFSPA
jgi:hypothetical protein